jgi:hypothetical protein
MTADHETAGRRPLLAAILTDIHFWVPFLVLLFGIVVLVICARS